LPEGCDILWTIRLSPQFLWRKLRDGIGELERAALADRLAESRLDSLPSNPRGSARHDRRLRAERDRVGHLALTLEENTEGG
jgi:hypothetical protein